jgi:hypothetical protein
MMPMHGSLDRHFWITRAKAQTMGVNFSAAMRDGLLPQADFVKLISGCRTCATAGDCFSYLNESNAQAPAACSHTEVLRELALLQAK